MDAREQKGLALAKDTRIKLIGGTTWRVPSATDTSTSYIVNVAEGVCSCPDFELRRSRCKHIWAVQAVRTVETKSDGSTVVTETVKVVRKTYSQPWAAYNAAQCEEEGTVQTLLRSLCDGVQTPAHPGRGPKPVAYSDAIFAMGMKVFGGLSARRSTTDIEACAEDGHMSKALRYNTVIDSFNNPALTPILTRLIEQSAAPLATVETAFAVDSTGFGTTVYRRWFDAKYGKEMAESTWLKAHAMIGTTTNVVTSVTVTDSSGADSPQLPELVERTGERFQMREISADKAYLGHQNLAVIESAGAVPYIPFKTNSRGEGSAAWVRMWGLFMYKQPEFLAHYHKRSNVEATFSAIKRKFGGSVRSKKYVAQVNEVLVKILLHNLSCIVHAMHELGIEATFGQSAAVQA